MLDDVKRGLSYEGFYLINSFFDVESEIIPIQKSIHDLSIEVAKRHSIPVTFTDFNPETFDEVYIQLLNVDRTVASEVYDLVKQLPPFLRLICGKKSEDLFCALRATDSPGIGAGSYGIRIDNPSEKKFQSHWHQEFFYQPQSIDGIVFWTPLVSIDQKIGPVKILSKSHKAGLCNYAKTYENKSGAYQLGIYQEDNVIKKYDQKQPLPKPGDLLLMDFLTIHSSGDNFSERSRWSIQYRLFNHKEPIGAKIGWKSSITLGTDIEKIFPDNFKE